MRYSGWKVRWGFLPDNFGAPLDAPKYTERVRAALAKAFPGAEVEVRYQAKTRGVLPYDMRAAVFNPVGEAWSPACPEADGSADLVHVYRSAEAVVGAVEVPWVRY